IVEFTGEAIHKLSMDERMMICNMSIEAGAKAGLISPDQTTLDYIRGRKYAPQGEQFEEAANYWLSRASDEDATYNTVRIIHAEEIEPIITWGTNPSMGTGVSGHVPTQADYKDESDKAALQKALDYMGLLEGQPLTSIDIQHVFIGSCT
ncbi:aconitase family protein, partial [Lysinibacillus sp. D4A3_S15]|uniref:aconitase family protein n=1 Tax=Lysinibacillus sp. D4A3_S15 TaxID=2941227 RepID=UPI0020C14269